MLWLVGELRERAMKRRGDRRQYRVIRLDAYAFPPGHRIDVRADRRSERLL